MQNLGRFQEISADEMSSEQRVLVRQMIEGPRGRIPVPFKIWLSNPDIAGAFDQLSNRVIRRSLLSAREREIVILMTANVMKAPYMKAAHRPLAAKGGLAVTEIEAICKGSDPTFQDPREQTIFDLAKAILFSKQVDEVLHERAVGALGHAGFCDLVGLLGFYFAVGATLSFYDIPAPE